MKKTHQPIDTQSSPSFGNSSNLRVSSMSLQQKKQLLICFEQQIHDLNIKSIQEEWKVDYLISLIRFDMFQANQQNIALPVEKEKDNDLEFYLAEEKITNTNEDGFFQKYIHYEIPWKQFNLVVILLLISAISGCFWFKNQIWTSGSGVQLYQSKYQKNIFEEERGDEFLFDVLHIPTKVEIYQPVITLYEPIKLESYEQCISKYYDRCYQDRLANYGSMISELEQWLLLNLNPKELIAFQFSPDLTVAIVLAAKLYARYERQGHLAETIQVISLPSQNQHELDALKLTLIKEKCIHMVKIVESLIPPTSELMKQFSMIYCHEEFFNKYLGSYDDVPSDLGDEKERMSVFRSSYRSKFANTQVMLILPLGLSISTQSKLFSLGNQVDLITYSLSSNFYTEKLQSSQAIRLMKPMFCILHIYGVALVERNEMEKVGGKQVGVNENVVLKREIMFLTDGMSAARLPCDESNQDINKQQVGNQYETLYWSLLITRNAHLAEEQLQNVGYFFRFLLFYTTSINNPNILYIWDTQLTVNVLKMLNYGTTYIGSNLMERANDLKTSLDMNKFEVKDILLQTNSLVQTIGDLEIKVIFVKIDSFVSHKHEFQQLIKSNVDVLLRFKGTRNEQGFIKEMSASCKIYLIHKSSKLPESKCPQPFLFDKYETDSLFKNYQNGYILISNYEYSMPSVSSVVYENSYSKRELQFRPYKCAHPPYFLASEEIYLEDYSLLETKYGLTAVIENSKKNVYIQHGCEDESILEFTLANLKPTDHILIFSDSHDDSLLKLTLARLIAKEGILTLTAMQEKRQNAFLISASLNSLEDNYQLVQLSSTQVDEIHQLYQIGRFTVIFLDIDILKRDIEVWRATEHEVIVLLKLDESFKIHTEFLMEVRQESQIYRIVDDHQEMKDKCQNYKLRLITEASMFGLGWLIVHF